MSQLPLPMTVRVMRDNLAKLLDISWFDLVVKTACVLLYVGIIAAAVETHSPNSTGSKPVEGMHSRPNREV